MSDIGFVRSDLEIMLKPELQAILRQFHLPVTGNKADLINRILEFAHHSVAESLRLEIELTKLELATAQLQLSKLPPAFHSTKLHKEPAAIKQAFQSAMELTPALGLGSSPVRPIHSTLAGAPEPNTNNNPAAAASTPLNDHGDHQAIASMIGNSFAELVETARMPSVHPPTFDGDLLAYPRWHKAFTAFLSRRPLSANDKLYYLEKYTTGEAADMIASFMYLKSDEAFYEALAALDEQYGNPFLVSQAFKRQLYSWPKIPAHDGAAMQKFTNFLKQCLAAMNEISGLVSLNEPESNHEIVKLLPNAISIKWNNRVTQYQMDHCNEFPPFSVFVSFMDFEAKSASNPITSMNALKASSANTATAGKRSSLPVFQHKHGYKTKATTFQSSSMPAKGATTAARKCPHCKSIGHWYLAKCEAFKVMSVDDRIALVRKMNNCFRCLGSNHTQSQCTKSWKCSICHTSSHNSLLHKHKPSTCNSSEQTTPNTPDHHELSAHGASSNLPESRRSEVATTHTISTQSHKQVFTKTVPVWLSSKEHPNNEILVYALLDQQSNATYVSNEAVEALDTAHYDTLLELTTLTTKRETARCSVYPNLRVRGYNSTDFISLPPSYNRELIPYDSSNIPSCHDVKRYPHLSSIRQHIPPPLDCAVGLLIGADCPAAVMPLASIEGPPGLAYAENTKLGWCIVGPSAALDTSIMYDNMKNTHTTVCVESKPVALPNPDIQLPESVAFCYKTHVKEIAPSELIRQIDGIDFQTPLADTPVSQHDKKFLQILSTNIHQDADGYYTMPLPFINNSAQQLLGNYDAVLKRFNGCLAQFNRRDPTYKQEYTKFMDGVIERGEAELVVEPVADKHDCWYLPHHGVYHKTNGKLRVVFDCSAEYNGMSLNNALLQGPDLNNSLLGVLLRFRAKPVAVSCDIEKMYHRFRVTKEDRDYLRFLWLDKHDQIQSYRMCVHIFGAKSSPNCAKFGLNKVADDYAASFPKAQQFIKRNFYVDDGLTSVDSIDEAIQLLKNTRTACDMANLKVHKLLSNKNEVLQAFPASIHADTPSSQVSLLQSTERALGMLWSLDDDTFRYNYAKSSSYRSTRRSILADIASVYDPMGLLSPLLLPGRLILQEISRTSDDWDQTVSDPVLEQFNAWQAAMSEISTLHIPRCITPLNCTIMKREIHTFADASEVGYGACTYARFITDNETIHCSLLLGKSRVAPLKPTTIPRLELQAAVLAARQSKSLAQELDWEACDRHLWTDSNIVLGYINNDAKRFHTYVANRISLIHELSSKDQWHHVASHQNAADIASRGSSSVLSLQSSMWFHGPPFLWSNINISNVVSFTVDTHDSELRKQFTSHAVQASSSTTPIDDMILGIIDNSSSWYKTQINVAAVLSVKTKHSFIGSANVTPESQQNSVNEIIRVVQSKHFSEEMKALRNNSIIAKTSPLRKLDCYIDSVGIMRVGGRIRNASALQPPERHPTVLPKQSNLTVQIIRYYHTKVAHQGRVTTMSAVRSAGYWIVGLSARVASVIYHCVTCRKLRRPTETQKMAELPFDRVQCAPPFTYTGCDVFGPFIVKEYRKSIKRYGLLITCLSSRAVHIEILDDMTSDCFIQSWRCFVALRGDVKLLRCDCGTNFVGAYNELCKAFAEMIAKPQVANYLRVNQCKFLFNPPQASHMGGSWERLIRIVRSIFSVLSMNMNNLTTLTLRTLMYECMAIMNSRPLTHVNEEVTPLTPNHLLQMKSDVVLPIPGYFESSDLYARKRWRTVQYLTNQFWVRWKTEYLRLLQERAKWHDVKRNLQIGDIVILSNESNRLGWRMGKVIDVHRGHDQLVRSVKVESFDQSTNKKSVSVRPISKVVVLVEPPSE